MNDILQDLTITSLTTAIEENLFSWEFAFRKWPRVEVHDEAALQWSISDIPFPLFNSVMRSRLPAEEIDAAVQAIIARAKSRGVPLLWWIGPQTTPADLSKHLERHGFVSEGYTPGMAVLLTDLKTDTPAPPGLHIQQVNDNSALKLWSQVCGAGFGMPDFVIEAIYDLFSHIDSEIMQAYLGWLDDRPVATSLRFLAAGVAGIYYVATIPEARRQGIGAVMTTVPLIDAQAMGYRAGILHASEMGVGMYHSLGFQEYCKIEQYVWAPA